MCVLPLTCLPTSPSAPARLRVLQYPTTLANQLFSGILRSEVHCSRCGHTSATYDPFQVRPCVTFPVTQHHSTGFKNGTRKGKGRSSPGTSQQWCYCIVAFVPYMYIVHPHVPSTAPVGPLPMSHLPPHIPSRPPHPHTHHPQDLSLELGPGTHSVTAALAAFTEPERLDGDNKYRWGTKGGGGG